MYDFMRTAHDLRPTRGLVRWMTLSAIGLGVATLAWSASFHSQTKWTLDGGGSISSGGSYMVKGTVGQFDAQSSSGGGYFLRGGFWPESAGSATDVEGPPLHLPERFELHPNAPNPFNPATTIRFDLPADRITTVEVFNLRGARVRVLHDGSLAAGRHALRWDGRDDRGAPMASGVYLVQVRAGDRTARQKVSLIK